jgi:hypothetical protein
VNGIKRKAERADSYFVLPFDEAPHVGLCLLRLLLLELGPRARGDDGTFFGRVLGRAVVGAPLGGDVGWDPVGWLRTTPLPRRGGEVIVLHGRFFVALLRTLAEGEKGQTLHGGKVWRRHGIVVARR